MRAFKALPRLLVRWACEDGVRLADLHLGIPYRERGEGLDEGGGDLRVEGLGALAELAVLRGGIEGGQGSLHLDEGRGGRGIEGGGGPGGSGGGWRGVRGRGIWMGGGAEGGSKGGGVEGM